MMWYVTWQVNVGQPPVNGSSQRRSTVADHRSTTGQPPPDHRLTVVNGGDQRPSLTIIGPPPDHLRNSGLAGSTAGSGQVMPRGLSSEPAPSLEPPPVNGGAPPLITVGPLVNHWSTVVDLQSTDGSGHGRVESGHGSGRVATWHHLSGLRGAWTNNHSVLKLGFELGTSRSES
ncbi:hypothetical protein Tco_0667312 [Tanacetum coccineum]